MITPTNESFSDLQLVCQVVWTIISCGQISDRCHLTATYWIRILEDRKTKLDYFLYPVHDINICGHQICTSILDLWKFFLNYGFCKICLGHVKRYNVLRLSLSQKKLLKREREENWKHCTASRDDFITECGGLVDRDERSFAHPGPLLWNVLSLEIRSGKST